MKLLDSLRIFVTTQKKGSLSAAERSLGLSAVTVSRRITALEDEMGVQLVDRISRNRKVTEAGQAFLEHAERVLKAMSDAEQAARDARERPFPHADRHSRDRAAAAAVRAAVSGQRTAEQQRSRPSATCRSPGRFKELVRRPATEIGAT